MRSSARRRGQVLVYPWVHPAALAAVAVAVLLAVLSYEWATRRPHLVKSTRTRVRPVHPAPAPQPPSAPLRRAGRGPDALLTGSAGQLTLTVLDVTLQNGAGRRAMEIAIEPYGLALKDSAPFRVAGRGSTNARRVPANALVKFHVAPYGPGWVRTLTDTPFYDAPHEPRTRLVFAGEPVPHLDRGGFAGQPGLRSILKRFVAPDGTARLAPNQALLLWEFTSEFVSPAADFQDVVALVELVR